MPVTPTGPISLPLENLKALLANCAAFRSWVGAADVAAARERIHLCGLPAPAAVGGAYGLDELESLRPFAVIDEFAFEDNRPGGDAWVSQRVALGAFVESGRLLVRFEDDVPAEDARDIAAAKLALMNRIGALVTEMRDLGGGDSEYLSIHRITRHHPFERADESQAGTQGDYWQVSYRVDWGI